MACCGTRAACVGLGRRVALRRFPLAAASSPSMTTRRPLPFLFPRGIMSFHHTPRAFKSQSSGKDQEVRTDSTPPPTKEDVSSERWKIKMLYDGECPLCMREVNMLREKNKIYGAIKFVDISSKDYTPEDNQGLDYETVMGRIHAILSDGTVVRDIEAFRKLYEEVGLGWVYAITKYEPVATIASAVYGIWARYRLQITGRPSLNVIMDSRKKDSAKLCQTRMHVKCNLTQQ